MIRTRLRFPSMLRASLGCSGESFSNETEFPFLIPRAAVIYTRALPCGRTRWNSCGVRPQRAAETGTSNFDAGIATTRAGLPKLKEASKLWGDSNGWYLDSPKIRSPRCAKRIRMTVGELLARHGEVSNSRPLVPETCARSPKGLY